MTRVCSMALQCHILALVMSSFAAAQYSYCSKPYPTYICCQGHEYYALNQYDNCCGTLPYKTEDKICCEPDVLVDRPTGGTCYCCDTPTGWQGYDVSSYLCCDGNLSYKYWNDSCCGGSAYRSATHMCCGGVVRAIGEAC